MSHTERAHIRAEFNSERFADRAPREVYASLLDEGIYLFSWSTMYRVLRESADLHGVNLNDRERSCCNTRIDCFSLAGDNCDVRNRAVSEVRQALEQMTTQDR